MRQLKDNPNYLVTVDGRVFSLHSMRFLKNFLKAGDYVYVKIGSKTHRVHRLVAQTYIPNPENKPTVNHMDGNKENNMLCNLEWMTSSENMQHACDTGLRPVSQLMRENGKRMKGNLMVGSNPYAMKIVLNEETGIYYESATEAAEAAGLNKRYLWRRLSGDRINNTNFKYV
jgi:hypothetical protein